MMLPAVSYQGGKQRIAGRILDLINPEPSKVFCDLCCGSGAISIELVNRGFDPRNIVMLDRGPWGLFWEAIGNGSFDLDLFYRYCDSIPKDPDKISGWMRVFSNRQLKELTPYAYPILQAASFGGKAIWADMEVTTDGREFWVYRNLSFRSHWKPTATSNRRSPVNPMMPMPDTLFERVRELAVGMKGVKGLCQDVTTYKPPSDALVYIDPPYDNTTAYGYKFDVISYVTSLPNRGFVSEGKPLSEDSELIVESKSRKKGGISGNRETANEEWLSRFNVND